MKDLSRVLLEKEQDILRVRQEIEALRLVIALLVDEGSVHIAKSDLTPQTARGNRWPLEIQGVH